ncbi:type III PLP-dependent enzyme [Paenibacillus campi]|uniref:type III PLP-dependent enzyme n=1 Tax=Paenibacillus campi TaxID=3106031 RepID=UPI002AFDF099|nr:type III PLP-dependent enzyme [Paenibacillus sp. SGZ-1014]
MKQTVSDLLNEIVQTATEPVCAYIYDLAGIQQQVRHMLTALPQRTSLFYAIKANPDVRVIEALLPLVGGFEVASIGELMKVRSVSREVPILFGGPGKKEHELEQAIEQGVYALHVESLLELRRIIHIVRRRNGQAGKQDLSAETLATMPNESTSAVNRRIQIETSAQQKSATIQAPVRIMLRINLHTASLPKTAITMGGKATPFGLDEQLLDEAMDIIEQEGSGAVQLSGFHFHSLSNNHDAALHADMVELYLTRAAEWKRRYRLERLELINAGGGLGVSYDEATPDFDWETFTARIAASAAHAALPETRIIFEPGRLLVADHGYYAAEIIDLKQSHGQQFAVLRGGTHHNRLPASWGHNHPFELYPTERWHYPWQRPEWTDCQISLVGELCTPKDRLHTDGQVGRIRVGDIAVFLQSGAYCWTISHHDFLGHPHPQFYYITEGREGEHVITDDNNEPIGQADR